MTRSRTSAALALAATLSLLAACGPATEDPDRTVSAPRVLDGATRLFPGEHAELTGRIGPAGRPVSLQREEAGAWVEVATARTGAKGRYTLDAPPVEGATRFRVVAARTSDSGARTSAPVTLTTVRPRLRLDVLGAPVGQPTGTTALADTTTGAPVTVTLRPARRVEVRIESRGATGWTTVATGTTDARGELVHVLPADTADGADVRLRAVADPGNGAEPATSASASATEPELVWRDEFDSETGYRASWRTRLQEYGGGRKCAKPDPAMARLRAGFVRLTVARDDPTPTTTCPYGTFKNAMIATRADGFTSFEARYGTFAARLRFQSARGQHGAFWLQGPSVTGAELDVAEYYGDGRPDGGLSAGVHHTVGSKVSTSGGVYPAGERVLGPGQTPSNGFHVYAVTWTPEGYVFRVDGRVVLRTDEPHVSDADEFLVLSLLTSDWELGAFDLANPRRGAAMDVDWVRAWQ